MRIRLFHVVVVVMLLSLTAIPVGANDEPLLDSFNDALKHEWLSVGVVAQFIGDFQTERTAPGTNGFSIGTFRVSARGDLDGGVSYFLQADFNRSQPLLDARIAFAARQELVFEFGAQKAPFSAEFLIAAPNIDFINRSRVVGYLAPGRQLGATVRGVLGETGLSYAVGMYNGNGLNTAGNENNDFLGAGRVQLQRAGELGMIQVGFSAGYGYDHGVPNVTVWPGERTLIGGDIRVQNDRVMVSSEVILATFEQPQGLSGSLMTAASDFEPEGYQVTGGVMVADDVQLLIRHDAIKAILSEYDKQVLLGLNWWPTGATEIQVNYVIPENDGLEPQFLLNVQLSI